METLTVSIHGWKHSPSDGNTHRHIETLTVSVHGWKHSPSDGNTHRQRTWVETLTVSVHGWKHSSSDGNTHRQRTWMAEALLEAVLPTPRWDGVCCCSFHRLCGIFPGYTPEEIPHRMALSGSTSVDEDGWSDRGPISVCRVWIFRERSKTGHSGCEYSVHTPGIAFRHLPPNSEELCQNWLRP